jgi:SET domain-containing protein
VKKIIPSDKIYISQSNLINAGRGVFANKEIRAGEIIEICPVIQVSEHDAHDLGESILVEYFFFFDKNNNRLLLALGFGSVYNHSHNSNAKYKIISSKNIMEISALKDIKKDDEITIHYNPLNPNSKIPLWFESGS